MSGSSWIVIIKLTLLLMLLIASPLAIPVVKSHSLLYIGQDKIWREVTITISSDYIVNIRLSLDKDDVYWDMSGPIEVYVEATATKYSENVSETHIILHIGFIIDNNVVDYNDYYVGSLSKSRNYLANTIYIYPTPTLVHKLLNLTTTLVQLKPSITLSTIWSTVEGENVDIVQSESMTPFTVYVGLEKALEYSRYRIEYSRIILSDKYIVSIKSRTYYKWDIDTETPSISLEIKPMYLGTSVINVFMKTYTVDKQLLSSEYLGELRNSTTSIEKEVYLPSDIVKAYSQTRGYVIVSLELILSDEASEQAIVLSYILKCTYGKPSLSIDLELPETIYSGVPVRATIIIRNNDLERIYVKEITIEFNDYKYEIPIDKVLSVGDTLTKEIMLRFNVTGRVELRLIAKALLLERYMELDISKSINLYIVNPLIISINKETCYPRDKLVLSINTVFINKTVSIIMKKLNETTTTIITKTIVSFPGKEIELTAPETPGTYIIRAITLDGIVSNEVLLNVSIASYNVSLVTKINEVEPGSKIEFIVTVSPPTKESLDIAILRFEELMGTWILVPGTVDRGSNGKYMVVIKAPDKPGIYKFKARVALKGKIVGESNEVTIVVGNATTPSTNTTSTLIQSVNQTTYLPIVPPQYTIGIIAVIPVVSILLWRKYRRR